MEKSEVETWFFDSGAKANYVSRLLKPPSGFNNQKPGFFSFNPLVLPHPII